MNPCMNVEKFSRVTDWQGAYDLRRARGALLQRGMGEEVSPASRLNAVPRHPGSYSVYASPGSGALLVD